MTHHEIVSQKQWDNPKIKNRWQSFRPVLVKSGDLIRLWNVQDLNTCNKILSSYSVTQISTDRLTHTASR